MLRILLLDCTEFLKSKLQSQGFNVESGTVGQCTGVRMLPSQVYEKDVLFYNPEITPAKEIVEKKRVVNLSREYNLDYIADRMRAGATFVAFVNPLSEDIEVQKWIYDWIPYMPEFGFSSDKVVYGNRFKNFPDSQAGYLAPIVTEANLSLPVRMKLVRPKVQDYPRDVFSLFWNGRGDDLGLLILRGHGRLVVLPKFKSNADVIETFLQRVAPGLYEAKGKRTLTDIFASPAEQAARAELESLGSRETELKKRQEAARVAFAAAARQKVKVIEADATAKQILVYYDQAKREDDAALFYLYKIVEAIENRFGGESEGIKAVGAGTEWKAVKKLANASYRDARHAPKPSDVIRKWTDAEIKECFTNVEAVIAAYFNTLFQSAGDNPEA